MLGGLDTRISGCVIIIVKTFYYVQQAKHQIIRLETFATRWL